jgi:hypothetical protein
MKIKDFNTKCIYSTAVYKYFCNEVTLKEFPFNWVAPLSEFPHL